MTSAIEPAARTAPVRTAMVTGAAQGIGRAVAARLAADGARVVLVDINERALAETAAQLAAAGSAVVTVAGDVAAPDTAKRAAALAGERFGGADILVNNAGISPKHAGQKATLARMALEEWRRVLDVNLTAAFLFCQACLPSMQARRWGRIVNMSSLAGRTRSDVPGVHYGATKAGIIGFSRLLANELGPDGITVNCVAPGRIVTPLNENFSEAENRAYLARLPVRRLGTPEEVAAAVAYLASDEAAFVTGAVIDVNGGAFMGG